MAEHHSNSYTGRTVAVVGGGTLLLWLLFRGKGWGLGGKGTGDGPGLGPGLGPGSGSGSPQISTSDVGPRLCQVRIAASGIAANGKPATVEEAVATCRSTKSAEVLVTGGARVADREDLAAAFTRAGIRTLWVERRRGPSNGSGLGAGGSISAVGARVTTDAHGDDTARAAGHVAVARSTAPTVSTYTRAWVFPVPTLGDREAEISDGWGSPRTLSDGATRKHLGADIMFRRRDPRDLLAVYKPGTVNGERWYFMPDNVPALAVAAGAVHFARWTPVGCTVIIRHPTGWATYYTHLSSLAVSTGDTVTAGQPIGIVGGNPADRMPLKHLHFELWRHGTRAGVVDPRPYLDAWPHVTLMNDWTPGAPAAPTRSERWPNARPAPELEEAPF